MIDSRIVLDLAVLISQKFFFNIKSDLSHNAQYNAVDRNRHLLLVVVALTELKCLSIMMYYMKEKKAPSSI